MINTCEVDASKFWTGSLLYTSIPEDEVGNYSTLQEYVDAQVAANSNEYLIDPPDFSALAKPKLNATNDAWEEGGTAQDQTDHLDAYKAEVNTQIDVDASEYFFAVLGGDLYKVIAHLVKGQEAMAYHADNMLGANEAPTVPNAKRDDGSATTTVEYPIIEAEAAKRGITAGAMVSLIKPLSDAQWNLIRDIEKFRAPARDDVDAAADMAAVDVVYAQWQTDLASI
jgi:hypothetical protein